LEQKLGVFLDRDGVINKTFSKNGKSIPPRSVEEIEILPEVPEALEIFNKLALQIIIVTNQPDASRGSSTIKQIEKINLSVSELTGISKIYTCFHDYEDNCQCRKPLPGLLLAAAKDLDIDLSKSYMVGDRLSDVEAGNAAGCQSFLVNDEPFRNKPEIPFRQVSNLYEAALLIKKDFYGKNGR
jgi:D-glycero-D-manno-heptose 1,7-bisphosphate phosphatase